MRSSDQSQDFQGDYGVIDSGQDDEKTAVADDVVGETVQLNNNETFKDTRDDVNMEQNIWSGTRCGKMYRSNRNIIPP